MALNKSLMQADGMTRGTQQKSTPSRPANHAIQLANKVNNMARAQSTAPKVAATNHNIIARRNNDALSQMQRMANNVANKNNGGGSNGVIRSASSATSNTGIQNSTPTVNAQSSLQNSYNDWLKMRMQQAQDAYNRNSMAINNMYANRLNGLQGAYGSGKNALAAQNAAAQENLRKSKEEAQRQAYIQSQEAERDMEQNLAAQGLSGGASESTQASMRNNYASNRNSNEEEYMDNATDLATTYQSQLASMESQYQALLNALETERAQAIMENENALANAGESVVNQFADYGNQLNYAQFTNDLNMQAYEKKAALDNYYAQVAADRAAAAKVNYQQSNAGVGESNSRQAIKNLLIQQGYTDEQAEAILSDSNY